MCRVMPSHVFIISPLPPGFACGWSLTPRSGSPSTIYTYWQLTHTTHTLARWLSATIHHHHRQPLRQRTPERNIGPPPHRPVISVLCILSLKCQVPFKDGRERRNCEAFKFKTIRITPPGNLSDVMANTWCTVRGTFYRPPHNPMNTVYVPPCMRIYRSSTCPRSAVREIHQYTCPPI